MAKLVVFSGAGLSAESGLSTFRDDNGLWAQYDPMEVCNYNNWLSNFSLVHKFYNLRRKELEKVQPNKMHNFLAQLPMILNADSSSRSQSDKPIEVIYITQNVDDLLERAGANRVVHLHGELTKIICPRCETIFTIGYNEFQKHDCQNCQYQYLKPFVVFFFEHAPQYTLLYQTFENLTQEDCVLVIGTSANVIDVNSLVTMAEKRGKIGYKILNNLEYHSNIRESLFDTILYMPATQAIERIHKTLEQFFNRKSFN
ncbi:NAD-dependent deacetylase [Helicobacter aurati]|uniref:protein acetyllysine N-acetyltransferase n=1 Tax=Helicobacter aurati TaxID=137778 RepID=A0A3D8J6P6_9HELI|nr:Sir2 family NAD-dependent protein deacetylase [Helicobacter aurati]RDU73118.1 NAD-dependent deacetylase [Helicobacter aurati]